MNFEDYEVEAQKSMEDYEQYISSNEVVSTNTAVRHPIVRSHESNRKEVAFMDFSNFERAWKTAGMLCKARCIPKEFWDNPADVLVVVQFGHELDISPMTAIQNVMIINNRPAVWGELMLALCVRTKFLRGGFIDCIETYDEDTQTAYCTVTRDGREPLTRKFSLEDAKSANLLGKPGSWQTSRKVMQAHRARTRALKDMYPDILKGVSGIEEMRDIDGQFTRVSNEQKQISTAESMRERLKGKLSSNVIEQSLEGASNG